MLIQQQLIWGGVIGKFTYYVLYNGEQTNKCEYEFIEGMTWADFYVSDFNVDFISEMFNPSKSSIYDNLDMYVIMTIGCINYNSIGVLFGDTIINGGEYYVRYSQGDF